MTDELSPSAAAALIGATTRSVQRWIVAGRLPARRVGGRWRVASDALDAFVAGTRAPQRASAPAPSTIRRVFVANRGEIAARIRRTCDALGIAAIVPVTDGAGALDLLDVEAVVAAARLADADALHPGLRVPRGERRLRRGRRGGRHPLDRTAAGRDPGDGRQGGCPPARSPTRDPDDRGLRRRGPGRRCTGPGRPPDRLPDPRQARGRRWRQGHADGP